MTLKTIVEASTSTMKSLKSVCFTTKAKHVNDH